MFRKAIQIWRARRLNARNMRTLFELMDERTLKDIGFR